MRKFKIPKILEYEFPIDVRNIDDIKVKNGTKVSAGDLLVLRDISYREVTIDLKDELKLNSNNIGKYLDVKNGDIVRKGSILAHRSILPVELIIKSPIDASVAVDGSKLVLNTIPQKESIYSPVGGNVRIVGDNLYLNCHMMAFVTNYIAPVVRTNMYYILNSDVLPVTYLGYDDYKDIFNAKFSTLVCLSMDPELVHIKDLPSVLIGKFQSDGIKNNENEYKWWKYILNKKNEGCYIGDNMVYFPLEEDDRRKVACSISLDIDDFFAVV